MTFLETARDIVTPPKRFDVSEPLTVKNVRRWARTRSGCELRVTDYDGPRVLRDVFLCEEAAECSHCHGRYDADFVEDRLCGWCSREPAWTPRDEWAARTALVL